MFLSLEIFENKKLGVINVEDDPFSSLILLNKKSNPEMHPKRFSWNTFHSES